MAVNRTVLFHKSLGRKVSSKINYFATQATNADNSVELSLNRLVNKALSSLFVVDCYVEMQTASLNFSIASPGTWLKSQSAVSQTQNGRGLIAESHPFRSALMSAFLIWLSMTSRAVITRSRFSINSQRLRASAAGCETWLFLLETHLRI